MCTDFTDLNKCCPMDYFPLAIIDKIIDYAVGCEKMALLFLKLSPDMSS
jgi:hypothetical protein